MRILYLDCFSGASGDMVLGALIDAGVPLADVRRALGTLAIDEAAVWTDRVTRAGVGATKFCVRGEDAPHDHAHDHDHSTTRSGHGPAGSGDRHEHEHEHEHEHHHHHRHEHHHDHAHAHAHPHVDPGAQEPHQHHGAGREGAGAGRAAASPPHAHETVHHHAHRTLADIYRLIDGSALSGQGRDRAKSLFARLGEVEAAIHGTSLDRVHLHEVGALDSIIDIVGSVFAIEALGVGQVVSSPLNVGSGSVRSAHGLYPVPAPATLRLLQGAPVYAGPQTAELVTPTGALLVTGYASSFGPLPAMTVERIGYGAGTREFRDTPNVLRAIVGEADVTAPSHGVVVVEAEIDDMNPQIFGLLMDRLLEEGALDVFYTPIQMKKNRPGTLLTVIAPPRLRSPLTATIFRETTTIGVRYREMTRECLERETVQVQTPLGAVRFKVARRNGEILNASPEFDDCVRIARERRVPVKDVQAAASKAFLDSRQ